MKLHRSEQNMTLQEKQWCPEENILTWIQNQVKEPNQSDLIIMERMKIIIKNLLG